MVKHVEMSSFLDVGISNITNLGGNRFDVYHIVRDSNPCKCYFCHVRFMLPGCEISRITKVCYVRNADVEKTRHFNMLYHVIST